MKVAEIESDAGIRRAPIGVRLRTVTDMEQSVVMTEQSFPAGGGQPGIVPNSSAISPAGWYPDGSTSDGGMGPSGPTAPCRSNRLPSPVRR